MEAAALRDIGELKCLCRCVSDLRRWQVYRESGRYVDAFLELQQLRMVAPRFPGLTQLLTEAAQAAAGSRTDGHGRSNDRVGATAIKFPLNSKTHAQLTSGAGCTMQPANSVVLR